MRILKEHVVYSIWCPITKELKYIGCTRDLIGRMRSHYNSKNPQMKEFMDGLKEKGLMPVCKVIEPEGILSGPSLEKVKIKEAFAAGHKLFNKFQGTPKRSKFVLISSFDDQASLVEKHITFKTIIAIA